MNAAIGKREKIDHISGDVVDSNPYSRLMALKRMVSLLLPFFFPPSMTSFNRQLSGNKYNRVWCRIMKTSET
jgi:hypothetical protein